MIVLDNGDKLRASGAVASKIDYSVHGVDGTALKQLADGQLAAAMADIYTASDIVVVSVIIFVNTDTATRAVNLSLLPSGGTARKLMAEDIDLAAGASLHFDGKNIEIFEGSVYHASQHEDGGVDEIDCTGLAGRIRYVDRDDPAANDFDQTDLVHDGAWHDLSLAAIVPAGAVAVILIGGIADATINTSLQFRKNGLSNAYARYSIRAQVAGQYIDGQAFVGCDTDRKIEYKCSSTINTVDILVLGWFI